MQDICASFDEGKLSHDKEGDVLVQLSAESGKRIIAFVFEQLFREHLVAIAKNSPELTFSFGWHIGYNKFGDPAFWFRLEDDENLWNACDAEIATRLEKWRCGRFQNTPTRCFKVRRSHVLLVAQEWSKKGWGSELPLKELLPGLQHVSAGDAKPMDSVDPEVAKTAIRLLKGQRLSSQLSALSVQRRFMNCMLRRYLGREGTDLDAMVLANSGELNYIEFKRKYPAQRSKAFGIDRYPHVQTMLTMRSLDVGMQHLILVPPNWDKTKQPLDWANTKFAAGWVWLIANINEEAFVDGDLSTKGADSGQRHIPRSQAKIDWHSIRILHEDLALGSAGREKLATVICAPSIAHLPPVNYAALHALTVGKFRALLTAGTV